MAERDELKRVLDSARMEIAVAMKRVDEADDKELLAIAGATHSLAAFVDFNGNCSAQRDELQSQLAAFVDFNGSCAGQGEIGVDAIEKAKAAAFVDFNGSCGSLRATNDVIRRLGGAR